MAQKTADHQGQAPGDVDQVGHVGAEGEEVAVGEVDELEDPVDEGQPDGAERIDRRRVESPFRPV